MAETPKRDDPKSWPDRLVPDPKNPPELSMLQGWLGASSEDKHRRLYLDPELSQSLEIPEDAIVHTQDIPAAVSPLGGTWVWVKVDAAIKQGPGLERLYARFLRGQIQQDFFAGVGGAGFGGAGTVGAPGPGAATSPIACPPQTIFGCPTQQVWCKPSVFTICPSRLTICPSRPIICQITISSLCTPSAAVLCQTRICPSIVDACPSAPGGCWDPNIFQQVVQPGVQGGFGGGLGFDPGAAGGGFVGAPGPGGLTSPIICAPQTIVHCPTQQIWCKPSVFTICPSQLAICPTRPLICQVTASLQCVPSAVVVCPTRICPSAIDACPSAPGGCWDPNIFQQVVQPGVQGGFGGGGLGFDPGAAAGGFVGAPGAGGLGPIQGQLGTQFVICHPSIIQICPTRSPICVTRTIQCRSVFTPWCPTQPQHGCCPTLIQSCATIPGLCHTAPPFCPIPTLPGGCPSGPVCFDPGGGGIDPTGGAGFDPNMTFDPAGGGLTGGPAGQAVQFQTAPVICLYTRIACPPTVVIQQCYPTLVPQHCFTRLPFCVPVTRLCPTIACPTLAGCPSGPVCGGGGFPGGGGGFPGGGGGF
jgi:hypothetical protein